MIGDSAEHDVAGGAGVGLSTALITSSNVTSEQESEHAGIEPTITAHSVAEAAAVILSGTYR